MIGGFEQNNMIRLKFHRLALVCAKNTLEREMRDGEA